MSEQPHPPSWSPDYKSPPCPVPPPDRKLVMHYADDHEKALRAAYERGAEAGRRDAIEWCHVYSRDCGCGNQIADELRRSPLPPYREAT